MKNNSFKHAYLTLGLLITIVVVGSVDYSMLGYTTSEAIYQTIITIATVGFEEVHPLDNTGMWFTSVLVIFSIGIFAYAVTTFTRFIVEGDASDEEILKQANLQHAKAMITTLPVDADNLFVVLTARELNPSMKIISRASLDNSDVKLKRAGATNVIMPDKIGGQRMAKLVAQPDIVEFIDFMLLQGLDSVVLEEISCQNLSSCFAGKSISELDIRNTSGANIIGLKK